MGTSKEQNEYWTPAENFIYLVSCMVNGETVDASRVTGMNFEKLYKIANRHMMTGIIGYALESVGIWNPSFIQSKAKAIRKIILFDVERKTVLAELEKAGIWYMPLKGSVIQSFYPKFGMRQMSDNDILIDETRGRDVDRIMEKLGFIENHVSTVHSNWFKEPVCNFEMHYALFHQKPHKQLYHYYRDVKNRLVKDRENRFGFHFSNEDFYIYMIAHEYKHYANRGTGLRSLLDIYVYLKKEDGRLDWSYITKELKRLDIIDFEGQNRSLAMHLFGGERLTAQDVEMLDYIISSGTYGTLDNQIKNRISMYNRNSPLGKLHYLISRIVLPMDTVRIAFPLFAKYPFLLPFLPFYRIFSACKNRKGRLKAELKALLTIK